MDRKKCPKFISLIISIKNVILLPYQDQFDVLETQSVGLACLLKLEKETV